MIAVKIDIITSILITPPGYIGLTFSVLQKRFVSPLFTLKLEKLALCNPGVQLNCRIKNISLYSTAYIKG